MKRYFVFLFIIAIASIASYFILHYPLNLAIYSNEYILQTPLWIGLIAVCLVSVIFMIFFSFLRFFFNIPNFFTLFFKNKKKIKLNNTLNGIINSYILRDTKKIETLCNNSSLNLILDQKHLKILKMKLSLENHKADIVIANILKIKQWQKEETLVCLYCDALLQNNKIKEAHKVIKESISFHSKSASLVYKYSEILEKSKSYKLLYELVAQSSLAKKLNTKYREKLIIISLENSLYESETYIELNKFWNNSTSKNHNNQNVLCAYILGLYKFGKITKAIKSSENFLNNNWNKKLFLQYLTVLKTQSKTLINTKKKYQKEINDLEYYDFCVYIKSLENLKFNSMDISQEKNNHKNEHEEI